MKEKRISFGEYDASHIYEWYLAMIQIAPDQKHCGSCSYIAKRLEKFIGQKEVKELKRYVEEYPYG